MSSGHSAKDAEWDAQINQGTVASVALAFIAPVPEIQLYAHVMAQPEIVGGVKA